MTYFEIPDGAYALTAAMDDEVRRMSGAAPRRQDRAHPIFAFVGALGGLSLRIADLSTALGLAFNQGPVLARCRLSYPAPLVVDRTYVVQAEVEQMTRKPSRTFGTADHLHLLIRLSDDVLRTQARLHIIFPTGDTK